MIFFFIYLVVLFLCLFILFVISRHDFILLRQSISLRQVFDNAFFVTLFSFIAARLGYIFYYQKYELLNIFRFFYLTKYWGVLPFIGFIIMMVTLFFLFRKKKNKLRIFDIYLISFSPLVLLDIILQPNTGINFQLKIVSFFVLSLFYVWFLKVNSKFTLKDGFITSIIFITYSLVSLAFSFSNYGFLNLKYIWFQIFLVLSTIGFSVNFVLVQRGFFNK